MTASPIARSELDLPLVVTSLMKGVVYADAQPVVWRHLLQLQPRVRDYVETVGLLLVVDEAEGYAFLRQRPDDDAADGQAPVPRLVPRRSLSFPVSLLLALLRKRLAEFDAADSGTACVLTRQQILDLIEVFLPPASSEARLVDQVDVHIGKAVELGFLRKVAGEAGEPAFEIRRILKAFVDAQWLSDLDAGLRRYAIKVGALPDEAEPDQVVLPVDADPEGAQPGEADQSEGATP